MSVEIENKYYVIWTRGLFYVCRDIDGERREYVGFTQRKPALGHANLLNRLMQ